MERACRGTIDILVRGICACYIVRQCTIALRGILIDLSSFVIIVDSAVAARSACVYGWITSGKCINSVNKIRMP